MTEADTRHSSTEVAALVERFRLMSTANVSDAMERLGAMAGIQAIWPGARLIGPAFTVWTRGGDSLKIHEAVSLAAPGDIIVVNGEADTTRALIGEMLGARAITCGVAGFVVDGMVRDAAALHKLGMPVFARGITPAGPHKNGPGRLGETIAVGNVAVCPGDLILGDEDGVVVVPLPQAHEILDRTQVVVDEEAVKRRRLGQ